MSSIRIDIEEAEQLHEKIDAVNNEGEEKPWSVDDPSFRYAPKKPTEDPWALLLRPLLEKDKRQCDVWIDEVQNLLIFAGLFSAVVTSFVVESYKNLQPDPNDSIISLLSVIAISSQSSSNNSSSLPISQPPFTPAASSVRVNVLWFMSLVLSLTTVLVGIISLQWIREHQSYPALSPKEVYALLHMRTQSLRQWHVPSIFRTLPILLQIALALFLVGLIDFLLPFGNKIAAPISVMIGITLLFLLYTSTYPAIQGILLYMQIRWFGYWQPSPSPCPFKSPQSYIFLKISSNLFNTWLKLYRHTPKLGLWRRLASSVLRVADARIKGIGALSYIRKSYDHPSSWTQHDATWLSIRDAYTQCKQQILLSTEGVEPSVDGTWKDFPIFDLVRAIQQTSEDLKRDFASEYYCVSEISEKIALSQRHLSWKDFQLLNEHLQYLLLSSKNNDGVLLLDVFKFYTPFYSNAATHSESRARVARIFHHENLHMILDDILAHGTAEPAYVHHRLELRLRIISSLHLETHGLRIPFSDDRLAQRFPPCLQLGPDVLNSASGEPLEFYYQLGLLVEHIFKRIDEVSSVHYRKQLASGLLYHHFPYIFRRARRTVRRISTLWTAPYHNDPRSQEVIIKFNETFCFIKDRLEEQLAAQTKHDIHPSLMFYIGSLYAKDLLTNYFDGDFSALLSRLKVYKQRTIDAGGRNSEIETMLQNPGIYGPDVFTSDWWKFLDFVQYLDTSEKFLETLNGIHRAPTS
ncbi:hypothetical protein CPC08DRAFT_762346 [Agrocybe pediades]|nr:hypothetical protein CPC08DRAFT_762346 [Agrocybe pediades]